jgi:hypothetical protein
VTTPEEATPDTAAPAATDQGDNLQAIYESEVARQPYRFQWADRWWTLPHIAELDWRVQAEIEAFGEDVTIARIDELFVKIFGEEQAAEWDKVVRPLPFLDMLFRRWTAHSGREPGEQPALPNSSPSTARPSKRTSTGTTGSVSPRRSTQKPRKAATRRGNS